MKEKDLHKLIEQQDPKAKAKAWEDTESRLSNSFTQTDELPNASNTKTKLFSRKFVFIFLSCAIALIVAVVVMIVFIPKNSRPKLRYCKQEDFEVVISDKTIKEYSAQFNNELLYLDWYGDTEFYNSYVLKLNVSGEIICYEETVLDNETGYMITYYITDENTEIDIFDKYKSLDGHSLIKQVSINYNCHEECLATFAYGKYNYYVDIPECSSYDVLLNVIEQMIK